MDRSDILREAAKMLTDQADELYCMAESDRWLDVETLGRIRGFRESAELVRSMVSLPPEEDDCG